MAQDYAKRFFLVVPRFCFAVGLVLEKHAGVVVLSFCVGSWSYHCCLFVFFIGFRLIANSLAQNKLNRQVHVSL